VGQPVADQQETQVPFDPDDAEQLQHLIHELSEAMTATKAHLYASQRYERPEMREAIGKAIEQTNRAGDVVEGLSFIVSGV
jgi:hypothetical protein